jgi:hypothetical protein
MMDQGWMDPIRPEAAMTSEVPPSRNCQSMRGAEQPTVPHYQQPRTKTPIIRLIPIDEGKAQANNLE